MPCGRDHRIGLAPLLLVGSVASGHPGGHTLQQRVAWSNDTCTLPLPTLFWRWVMVQADEVVGSKDWMQLGVPHQRPGLSHIQKWNTLLGRNISPSKALFEDDFLILQVGYFSSLEGIHQQGLLIADDFAGGTSPSRPRHPLCVTEAAWIVDGGEAPATKAFTCRSGFHLDLW